MSSKNAIFLFLAVLLHSCQAEWRFEITPIGGSASCTGKLRFTLETGAGKLVVGGDKCNEGNKYVVRYRGVGGVQPTIKAGLNPITFNGHREECGNSKAGFYVEGWKNPRATCFKLTRRHKHGLLNTSCSNKERYIFKLEVFNNNKKYNVNFKDSSEVSCPGPPGSPPSGGGGNKPSPIFKR